MSNSTWSFSQTFSRQFQVSRTDLETRINAAQHTPSGTSQKLLQELAVQLAKLTKSLADATGSLPSYDQRQYEEQLGGLEKSLAELRTKLTPKSKFAFRRTATVSPANTSSNVSIAQDVNLPTHTPTPQISTTNLTLSSRSYQYLTLDSLPMSTLCHDLSISDLDHCIVNLIQPLQLTSTHQDEISSPHLRISALHVRNITNTVLILPSIDGSALIHNLSRCAIILASHQFRMHTSHNVDVYLFVSSNPVIEHCSNIRFSGYPSILPIPSKDEKPSKHCSVLDFSHIRSTPSPHWSVLENDDAVTQLPLTNVDERKELENVLEKYLPS